MVTATKSRKVTKKKSAAAARKQQKLECPECGLVLAVAEPCGCSNLSGLQCCGTPMRKKRK
jgi:hypothetical protein